MYLQIFFAHPADGFHGNSLFLVFENFWCVGFTINSIGNRSSGYADCGCA
jgi:hypothetical protein